MSRQTVKYKRAFELAISQNIPHHTSDDLYTQLISKGYYWDSNMQRWIYSSSQPNNPPSMTIKLRVLCDKNQAQGVAEKLTELMQDEGYQLLEKSTLYPCRPPQANDSRVYLVFNSKS